MGHEQTDAVPDAARTPFTGSSASRGDRHAREMPVTSRPSIDTPGEHADLRAPRPVPPCDDPAVSEDMTPPISAAPAEVHIPSMNLQEIHAALKAAALTPDARFAAIGPTAARVAIEMLVPITGLPLAAIDPRPAGLSERFPRKTIPAGAARLFGGDMTRYQAWRRQILDASMLATRVAVDVDPWDGLRRVARLSLGKLKADATYALSRHFPDTGPATLTLARALEIESRLSGAERRSFRNAWSVVVRLQDEPLAIDAGVFRERLGPLPAFSRLQPHRPLPPKLAVLAAKGDFKDETAAMYCWSLAVAAGIVEADSDPEPSEAFTPEAWKRLSTIAPRTGGIVISKSTFALYRGRFARTLIAAGASDPRMDPAETAWRQLNAAVRATGRSGARLCAIAPQAKAEGLRPQDLTGEWFARRLAAAPDRKRKGAIRAVASLLDRLRDDPRMPAALLPDRPTGLEIPKRPKAPTPPKPGRPPVERAWIDLFASARRAKVSARDLNHLSSLRALAITGGLRPSKVDRAWMESARPGMSRSRVSKLHAAARVMDGLRAHEDLLRHLPSAPIGALADHRRSAGDLPAAIAAELDALLDEQGVARSTRRGASIAVRALAEAVSDAGEPPASLDDLLTRDLSLLDRGRNRANAARHGPVLTRLRDYRALPWTGEWRGLQVAVSSAGVKAGDNPVAALLRHAEGRAPRALDLAWTRAVDRTLRRAGRADLAKTFAANLRRLDALHDVPDLAASGLLPPRF